jgi:spermidine synthase
MSRRGTGERLRQPVDTGIAELVPDPDRSGGWTLLVDGTPQSHVDLDDPRHLEFEYVRRMAHVMDLAEPGPLRALHLGGGALTLPRYLAATRRGSGQQVVEIDGALLELVRRELPLDRSARVRLRTGDARDVLARVPAGAFDLVVADVFVAGRTPAPFTSVEFAGLASRALRPDGRLVANVADGGGLAFTRRAVATVRAVFGAVALLGESSVLKGRRFGNLVLVGSHDSLPVDGYARAGAGDPFPSRVLHGTELDRFVAGARPVTDADAERSPEPPSGVFGEQSGRNLE